MKASIDGKSFRFELVSPGELRYEEAVALAKQVYKSTYDATINPAPDTFVVCIDECTSVTLGCAALSFGVCHTLFSEQYLDVELHLALQTVFGYPVTRSKAVEVTSLATLMPRAGAELVKAILILCWYWGMKAILCTATRRLRLMFERHGLPFSPLAQAAQERIETQSGVEWGEYYDTEPYAGVIRLDKIGHLFQSHCGKYDLLDCSHFVMNRPAPQDSHGDFHVLSM